MSIVTLKNQIKTKLDAIDEIQEVQDYPTVDCNGYPLAVVRSMGVDNEYETTCDNLETYKFEVYLVFENSGGVKTLSDTRGIVEGLCDTVRDNFDNDEFLSGLSLPSDRQLMGVLPALGEISEVEEGKYVEAIIILNIRVSKQLS